MYYIYFIQAIKGGPVKIGRTRSPADRMKQIQSCNPEELRFLSLSKGTARDELDLHKRFGPQRIRGEWFEDCEEIQQKAVSLGILKKIRYLPHPDQNST